MATYVDVTSIDTVSEADVGDEVTLKIYIKNTYSSEISLGVGVQLLDADGNTITGLITWDTVTEYDAEAGTTIAFQCHFTMPSSDVSAVVTAIYYGSDGVWYSGDSETISIALSGEDYAGSITSKYFNYDSLSEYSIPGTVTISDNAYEIGIKYKNSSSVSAVMGIELFVYDPDGDLVFNPDIDWAAASAGKSLTTEYQGGSLDTAGTWSYKMVMYIGRSIDTAVQCDSASGVLFNATSSSSDDDSDDSDDDSELSEAQFSSLTLTYKKV